MKYFMFPHLTKIEEKIVKSYGIVGFEKLFYGKIVKDITNDRNAIKHLVKDLNEYQLELVHLDDVIEDFLTNG